MPKFQVVNICRTNVLLVSNHIPARVPLCWHCGMVNLLAAWEKVTNRPPEPPPPPPDQIGADVTRRRK